MGLPCYLFEDGAFLDLWQRIAVSAGLEVRAKSSERNDNEFYSALHRSYHVSRGQGQVDLSVDQTVRHDQPSSFKDNCFLLWNVNKEGSSVASYLERMFLTAGGIARLWYKRWSYLFRCEEIVSQSIRDRKMIAGMRFDITTSWTNDDGVNTDNAYTEFMIRCGDHSVLAAIGPTVSLNLEQDCSFISIGVFTHKQKASVVDICEWLMSEGCDIITLHE